MTKDSDCTKILLVSDNQADVGNIRMRLEESINVPCSVWHCLTLSEALDHLDKQKLRVDIVILDLALAGSASPKEIYEKIGKAALNIPIIVVTGTSQEEHDLAIFVMEAGASDHIVRGQFKRLADAIEFSLIRHRIATTASDKSSQDLEISQNDHDSEMKDAQKESDEKNKRKNQYISWVMGGYSVEGNMKKP